MLLHLPGGRFKRVRAERGAVQMMATNGKLAWLTTSWDDGHTLDSRMAELLSKYGLPGTFYIPLENCPRGHVMDSRAIREIATGFEVGAHTVHHVALSEVSDEEAATEIKAPKKILEDITGKPCEMFCFPKGRFRRTQLRLVGDAGFIAARTVELMSCELPHAQDGTLVMPTTIHAYEHRTSEYLRNFAKRMAAGNLMNYLRSPRRNWVATARWFLEHTIQHGGVFHLWGHSWEIEEQGLWEQLEDVLRIVSEHKDAVRLATNFDICAYVRASQSTPNLSAAQA
jgi:peptidoglycan-N-acetylglucosamine deacetylase